MPTCLLEDHHTIDFHQYNCDMVVVNVKTVTEAGDRHENSTIQEDLFNNQPSGDTYHIRFYSF